MGAGAERARAVRRSGAVAGAAPGARRGDDVLLDLRLLHPADGRGHEGGRGSAGGDAT